MRATTEDVRAVGTEGVHALGWRSDIATRKADTDGKRRAAKANVRMWTDRREISCGPGISPISRGKVTKSSVLSLGETFQSERSPQNHKHNKQILCRATRRGRGTPPVPPGVFLHTACHHVTPCTSPRVRLTLSHRHPSHTSITQSPRNVSRPLTTSHTPHNKHSPTHHDPAAALTTADAARRAPRASSSRVHAASATSQHRDDEAAARMHS